MAEEIQTAETPIAKSPDKPVFRANGPMVKVWRGAVEAVLLGAAGRSATSAAAMAADAVAVADAVTLAFTQRCVLSGDQLDD